MAASSAVRVRSSDWEWGGVIRTPSTIGKVERKVGPKRRAGISCDWYQATMPSSIRDAVLEQLSSALGVPEVRGDIPKQMCCYRECLQFPNGARFYQSNRYNETCCLVISGKAKPTEHFLMLMRLIGLGVKLTRMDLAFDDRRGILSLEAVYRAIKEGSAVSRWKKVDFLEKTALASGKLQGRCIQIGSKSSASYLVIYDKGLETGSAAEGEWVRWELRLADSEVEEFVAAFIGDALTPTNAAVQEAPQKIKGKPTLLCYDDSDMPVLDTDISPELVERFQHLALQALKSRLSFRERGTTSNVSRAKELPWWDSLLEYFDPISEGMPNHQCAEYEGGPSLTEKKKRRETVVREQAEEILSEVYEEHIRPHASNRLEELLRNIPEYGDPAPECGADEVDEIALAFVGLHPRHEAMVLPFPAPIQEGASKRPSWGLQPRLAEVVTLPVRRSVSGGHDG